MDCLLAWRDGRTRITRTQSLHREIELVNTRDQHIIAKFGIAGYWPSESMAFYIQDYAPCANEGTD